MSRRSLAWTLVERETLAEHLRSRDIKTSLANPGLNLYHCLDEGGRESLAISLPEGQCLLVTLPEPAKHPERRKRRTEAAPRPATDGTPA